MNDFVDALKELVELRKLTEIRMWDDLTAEVKCAIAKNKSVVTLALKTQSDMVDADRIAALVSNVFAGQVEATVTQDSVCISVGIGANERNQNHSGYLTLKLL